ncbi:uncharacterized protein LOC121410244 [Lytechinus variegatus]|uniref:uncharacterized protein LOC121410244 n=1 Tax=Lytechinus variegatus TaxID=7654 RepID=UPI001BB0E220|nr:uncharacterized protein LOC121410244 [Lytechinus variegatus]
MHKLTESKTVMAQKGTSTSYQSYLTVVFLLMLIADQCRCNILDDMDMTRYNQQYKRGGRIECRSCATLSCIRTCALGKRSFSLEPEDHEAVSKDNYIPVVSSQTCLLDSFFELLSEEGKDRIIQAFLEAE